jgi:tetratricopeptide (TPR) repeat protein
MGYCLQSQRKYEEAVKLYDRALQIKPDYGYVHAELGRIFLFLDRPQETVESIGRAFRIEPKLEKQELYQVALASALGKLGRIDDALSAYQRAANLNPKDLDAQAGLGWALFESGRSKDAEQSLKTAIRLDPNDAYSYEILGKVLRELGRNEESISIWQRLTELRPKDSWAHASLGWALAGVGRLREAILALKKTSEIDPEFPAYDSIALYYAHLKKYQEAIDAGEKAILQQPDADTYCVLAAALLGQGKHELAIGACRQALELNPQFPEAWHNLG